MRFVAVVIVGLFAAACVTSDPNFTLKAQITACNGFAEALQKLAPYRAQGKLRAHEINTVEMLRPQVNKLCNTDNILPENVVEVITEATQQLILMRVGTGRPRA